MPREKVLSYLVIWSAIGCLAFSAYVVAAFRTGLVFTARKEDGTLKERIPLAGLLNMLAFLAGIIVFIVLANGIGLARRQISLSFFPLFLLNFGHYLLLFLYDSLVIDGLLLAVWRPRFLRLPEEMGRESMKKHMLYSLPVGILAGAVLCLACTAFSTWIWFR